MQNENRLLQSYILVAPYHRIYPFLYKFYYLFKFHSFLLSYFRVYTNSNIYPAFLFISYTKNSNLFSSNPHICTNSFIVPFLCAANALNTKSSEPTFSVGTSRGTYAPATCFLIIPSCFR